MVTASVRLKNLSGEFIHCRALLDTCATAHFITEKLVKRLSLTTSSCSLPITVMNGLSTVSSGVVKCTFYSLHSNYSQNLFFLVVPKITDPVPDEVFPRELFDFPKNIKLADPSFHLPQDVDMLIGSGVTLSMLSVGQIHLQAENGKLILQKTQLGWTVAGGITKRDEKIACHTSKLERLIENFWVLDGNSKENEQKIHEHECETHYSSNFSRDSSGRYIVKLPFREGNNVDLGDSRALAFRRFMNLEKRLRSNSELNNGYTDVMNEYIEKGHMTLGIICLITR